MDCMFVCTNIEPSPSLVTRPWFTAEQACRGFLLFLLNVPPILGKWLFWSRTSKILVNIIMKYICCILGGTCIHNYILYTLYIPNDLYVLYILHVPYNVYIPYILYILYIPHILCILYTPSDLYILYILYTT